MSLVRILIDGYSLLHSWPELAPGKARHTAAARDELVRILTLYRDATHTPITIFFDGSGPKIIGSPETASTSEVEILFSRAGQTADQMIERAAVRFQPYGEVLAVTDDTAERETVGVAANPESAGPKPVPHSVTVSPGVAGADARQDPENPAGAALTVPIVAMACLPHRKSAGE